MKITIEMLNAIVKQIPISYYTHTKKYTLTTSESDNTSHINFETNQITIALANINQALDSIKTNPSPSELERLTRGLVYHEVSHALLTPTDAAMRAFNGGLHYYNPTIQNILEDERIETIMAHYYLNTDFVANKKLILTTPTQEQLLNNFVAFVFGVARCNQYPHHYKIVKDMIDLSKRMRVENEGDYSEKIDFILSQCACNLFRVWQNERKKQQQEQQQEQQGDQNQNQQQEQQQEQQGDQNQNQQQEQQAQDLTKEEREAIENLVGERIMSQEKNAAQDQKDDNPDAPYDRTILDNSNVKSDNELKKQLIGIISKRDGFGSGKHYAGAGYNGQFNLNAYLLDAQRKDARFTRFKNTNTHQFNDKNAKTKILNIILDNSGSFADNDKVASEIIKTLCEIETMTNFKLNLYICDDYFVKVEGINRLSMSDTQDGGSESMNSIDLSAALNEITKNKTIALFDGDICTSYFSRRIFEKNIKCLDNPNVQIISEYENRSNFSNLTRCKIKWSTDYTNELKKNIAKAIEELYR